MSVDDWIAIWTMLLFGATLLGAIFVLVELRNGHKETKEANGRAKKQATVNFYVQTLERRIYWQSDLPLDRDARAIDSMLSVLKANPGDGESKALKYKIYSYLAFWELTAVAIRHDVFDEQLFQDILKTRFLQVEQHYRPFIEDARIEFGDSGKQLFVQLEKLADEWRNPTVARHRGIQRLLSRG